MRVALQRPAVFEGAGLALVDVDRHQPWCGLVFHNAPLAPCGESSATQTAQAGVFECRNHLINAALAAGHRSRQRVAALRAIGREIDWVARHPGLRCGWQCPGGVVKAHRRLRSQRGHALGGGFAQRPLADLHRRRLLAAADTRRGDHAQVVTAEQRGQSRLQIGQQGHRTSQLARQAVAHPQRETGRRSPVAQNLEVVVEAGHLKHLGHRQPHGLRQRHQVCLGQAIAVVVQPVQVLDELVARMAVWRCRANERLHLRQRTGIDRPALRPRAGLFGRGAQGLGTAQERGARHAQTRSTMRAMPWPTPMHMVHSA